MELQVLCVAAQEGDVPVVAAWLDDGGGVDERCAAHDGATLLFAAAYGRGTHLRAARVGCLCRVHPRGGRMQVV